MELKTDMMARTASGNLMTRSGFFQWRTAEWMYRRPHWHPIQTVANAVETGPKSAIQNVLN